MVKVQKTLERFQLQEADNRDRFVARECNFDLSRRMQSPNSISITCIILPTTWGCHRSEILESHFYVWIEMRQFINLIGRRPLEFADVSTSCNLKVHVCTYITLTTCSFTCFVSCSTTEQSSLSDEPQYETVATCNANLKLPISARQILLCRIARKLVAKSPGCDLRKQSPLRYCHGQNFCP